MTHGLSPCPTVLCATAGRLATRYPAPKHARQVCGVSGSLPTVEDSQEPGPAQAELCALQICLMSPIRRFIMRRNLLVSLRIRKIVLVVLAALLNIFLLWKLWPGTWPYLWPTPGIY